MIPLKVYTWGCNDEGALGRPTSGTDDEEYFPRKVALPDGVKIIQVSAGDSHTAALSDKGEVYAWGAYRVSQMFTYQLLFLKFYKFYSTM